MSNDLAIYLKVLLQDKTKSNLTTEIETLVKNIQQKLGNLTININSSSISNLVSQLEKLNEFTQNNNKSSTQNIQIIKELDGTVKKYSETVKANGEIIQKTTEIIDKNKTAKQQATKATDNINKEAEAVDKLITKYDKLIRTVKIKDNKGEVLRQDQTYLNSQTGVKTTVVSRPGQDNIYRTDTSKNNELLKEQMKLARESAKLAKESNDYHQKYYKVQQKAETDAKKLKQKNINEAIKQLQQEQKERIKNENDYIKLLRQTAKQKLNAHLTQQKILAKESKDFYKEASIRIKLLQQEQSQRQKLAQDNVKQLRKETEDRLKYLVNSRKININDEKLVQSQLNKLNPKVISSDKMVEQIKLMPIGTKEVDEAKRKVEAFQKYLDSLDLRIKKGELIPQEVFRILNRYESEVKRVIKNTQDMVNNSGNNTKQQKIFDFNVMTSELAMFKSEIEKMKSSLSVGGNVVNKSSIDEFGRLTLEIRNQAGYIEKIKFQWDSVSQSLRKVNIEQSQNNDALKTFKISSFKSIADISKNYKGFITKDEIKNLVDYIKNIEVLDAQTRKLANNRISNLSNKGKNNSEIQDLEHKLLLYKKIAEFESKNAHTRYGSNIDKGALDAYLSGVSKLNSSTDNLKKKMKELDVEYRRIVSNARTAAAELNNSNKSFMELFRIAMQRFPKMNGEMVA